MSNKKVKIRIETDGQVIEKEGKCLLWALIDDAGENETLMQAMLIGHDVSATQIGHTLADMPDGFLKDLPKSAEMAYRMRLLENTAERAVELKELTNKKNNQEVTIESGMDGLESDFQSWLKENAEGGTI